MTKESASPEGTASPHGGSERTQDQHFPSLLKDDEDEQVSGGLDHLVPRKLCGRGRRSPFCRLGSSGERDAEEHVPRDIHRRNKEVQEWKKGSKNQEVSTPRIICSKSVRQNSERIRTQEYVAGCRREKTSGVGITHHPGWERLVHREG